MASNLSAHLQRSFSAPALRSYLAEFISTFLFVFATVGSAVSARMLTPDVTSNASSLVATAVAQAFALFAAVFIAADVSGGHVNPAVTFAFALGGHIPFPTVALYWASQLLGSTFACFIVHAISAGQAVPTTRIAVEMTGLGAGIIEAMATFLVVYTVHAACDPRAGGRRGTAATAMGSLVIGLVTGACVLATGSLTGASMNPARSFGPAVVSGDFKNQAVYWAGPMIGAAAAALVHQSLVFPSMPAPLQGTGDGGCVI
ncbi:probable aquaporin TIP5-1 [Lolium rigidum]|uniref:probable aquaporin TIP5-1 n=1 Tax=Lolium rigidum TaxID=89674 RepID=UPI001F5C9BCD|nr:probable aquaporin TIP5-1 [Lolium rigidum]